MKILVINAGSSSLKYQLFDLPREIVCFKGSVEHIGEVDGVRDHQEAFILMKQSLLDSQSIESFDEIEAFGHRVVHGGDRFYKSVEIDDTVIESIETFSVLAPLHNPSNLLGIRSAQNLAPKVPHVAVFDTAFHQTMPEESYLYAIPKQFYQSYKIRRYGFHGSSHAYVSQKAAELLDKPLEQLNLITLHLGNGASLCAIKAGKSVDTSMGFTPLEGLVMGSRSGDIDPAIIAYLVETADMSLAEVMTMLNHESGLRGLSGSNDMSTLLEKIEQKDLDAQSALKIYIKRIQKYLAAYMVELGRVDVVVFTGGVGEHAAVVRQKVLERFEPFGIVIDSQKNCSSEATICLSTQASKISVWVIPTNEELYIAKETHKLISD